MAITTTYTCDCCKKSRTDPNGMINIAINYNSAMYGHGQNFHNKLWCSDCCKKFKLYWETPDQIKPPIITLEDVVREIIREEITNNATC